MTSAHIEEHIQYLKEDLASREHLDSFYRSYYEGRLEGFIAILKERAEDGTYDTAGYRPGDRHETQRTEYQEA
jgi:hypothetical protein